jgi:Zn-dependent metalloprotease
MATFLKKMVKEVQDIKQLIDIPEMKKQREAIKQDIQINDAEIAKYDLFTKMKLDNVIETLNTLNEQTPAFFPTTELQSSSSQLCEFFKQQYSAKALENLLSKQHDLQEQLEKIKHKLDKARK